MRQRKNRTVGEHASLSTAWAFHFQNGRYEGWHGAKVGQM
jgi:hypothetical protein